MRYILIAALFLFSISSGAAELGMGMALQGRVQNDVNPDFYETRALGQLFGRVREVPWSGLLEIGEERRNTSSGSLSVNLRTRSLGLWGRYEPVAQYSWSPFLGLGLGIYEDRVETQLSSERVRSSGRRLYLGGALGLSRTLWQQGLLELEMRGQAVEQNVSPVLSGLIRVGYIF